MPSLCNQEIISCLSCEAVSLQFLRFMWIIEHAVYTSKCLLNMDGILRLNIHNWNTYFIDSVLKSDTWQWIKMLVHIFYYDAGMQVWAKIWKYKKSDLKGFSTCAIFMLNLWSQCIYLSAQSSIPIEHDCIHTVNHYTYECMKIAFWGWKRVGKTMHTWYFNLLWWVAESVNSLKIFTVQKCCVLSELTNFIP